MNRDAGTAASGKQIPTYYARAATGLVRELPVGDMVLFNAASTTPLGAALAIGFFYAMASFPRSNVLLALGVALIGGLFIWITFALMGSTMPKVGGDYVYNARILHPIIGFGGNLSVFVSTLLGVGIWAFFVPAIGIGPAFGIIGTVTGRKWWLDASTKILSQGWTLGIAIGVIALLSILSILGTKLVVRAMSVLYTIGFLGFAISFVILLFTSHTSFVSHLNTFSQPITHQANTYQATIADAAKAGLTFPGKNGFSGSGTLGAIYVALTVTIFVWWGVYMAGETKGGGRRKRQLTAIVGAGLGQGLLVLIAAAVFLRAVGYNFFAAANAGHFGVPQPPYFNFFASIATSNQFLAILMGLTFIGWFLPGVYINMAMCHRAPFAWAFDGIAPRRLAAVSDRTHTPVVSIVLTGIGAAAAAAWATYSKSFLTVLTVVTLLAFVPIVFTGIAAVLMSRLRPDIYRDSPANWKPGGIPVLAVAGVGCAAVAMFAIVDAMWFHTALGISKLGWTIALPFIVILVAAAYYLVARRVQRGRGIDLDMVYKTIPPD